MQVSNSRTQIESDRHFMNIAIAEARKGLGFTSPNPLVGAVIVKEGEILSTGYHHFYGGDHAEVDAIKKLSPQQLKDSTIYVTLEPCCHYGNTPPCTEAIIKAAIKRVVIANVDLDERVKDKSINILRDAGIEVTTGVLEEEAYRLNPIYFFYRRERRPYIVMKAAMTLDGKIAASTGHSKWISNDKARTMVHKLRRCLKAIAIGRASVESDSPRLNCRLPGYEKKPVDRLVFTSGANEGLLESFKDSPGRSYLINGEMSRSRESFLEFCRQEQIDSILVEGGGGLYSWFLKEGLVDRLFLFYKPAFLGKDGIPVFTGEGVKAIDELEEFKLNRVEAVDNNILIDLTKGEALCLPE